MCLSACVRWRSSIARSMPHYRRADAERLPVAGTQGSPKARDYECSKPAPHHEHMGEGFSFPVSFPTGRLLCEKIGRSGRICSSFFETLKSLTFSNVGFDFVYSPCVLVSRRLQPLRLATHFCRQCVEQRLSLLQIARVEAFCEPAVNWSEQFASLPRVVLIAPEPRHAHRRT